MIRQNLHCHTTFDDGADSAEAMVLAAERAGLTSIGVSLHSPIAGEDWCCPDGQEPDFVREMHRLRDKYAGRIRVYCGIEFDLTSVCDLSVYDYVIASVHRLDGFYIDYTQDVAKELIAHFGGDQAAAQVYYERVSAIAQMPEADIVGHFDLLTKYNEREPLYDTAGAAYRDAAFAAMDRLNAAGKIFEINSGAISRGYRSIPYPEPFLLRRLHEIGGRICISSDAHSADAVTCAFRQSEELARACSFTEVWAFNGTAFEAVKL